MSAWSKEFNLDAVTNEEIASLQAGASEGAENFMEMESSGMAPDEILEMSDEDVSGEDMEMDQDEDEEVQLYLSMRFGALILCACRRTRSSAS